MRPSAVISRSLGSFSSAQATQNLLPLLVLGVFVATVVGGWVDDGDGLLLGEGELWGVLVGWPAGVLAGGEVEDLGLHCPSRLLRFFLAIPW